MEGTIDNGNLHSFLSPISYLFQTIPAVSYSAWGELSVDYARTVDERLGYCEFLCVDVNGKSNNSNDGNVALLLL